MALSDNFKGLTKEQRITVHDSLNKSIKIVEQRAGQKLQRMDKKGIKNISNADPRRSPERIKHYTLIQKQSYLNTLNNFNSRSYKPVVGAKNEALDPEMYKKYVQHVKSVNSRANKMLKPYENKLLPDLTSNNPSSRKTIKQRTGEMMSHLQKSKMYNPSVNPLGMNLSNPEHIKSQKALEGMLERAEKRDNPDYIKDRHEAAVIEANAMMKEMKGTGKILKKELNNLTSNQFDVLWNFTGFANSASTAYEIITTWNLKEKGNATYKRIYDNDIREAKLYLDWVKENIK